MYLLAMRAVSTCVRVSAYRSFSAVRAAEGRAEKVWNYYNQQLTERPILTKSITSGVLSFFADVLCQKLFPQVPQQAVDENLNSRSNSNKNHEKPLAPTAPEFSYRRTFNFTFLGVVLVGPMLHYWYGFLARRIPGAGMYSALQRLALDQLMFAPFCIVPAFLSGILLLEGKPDKIGDKLRADWFSTVVANFAVWTPCQFINFKYLKPRHQVLFANMVGFFWNIYLSHKAAKPPIIAHSNTATRVNNNNKNNSNSNSNSSSDDTSDSKGSGS